MKSLVFFGSLRSKKLLKIVLERKVGDLNISLGKIPKHKSLKVQKEDFPYLSNTRNKNDYVICSFVEGLTNEDYQKILFYESIEYKLCKIKIIIDEKLINSYYFKLIKEHKTKINWSYENWQTKYERVSCKAAKLWMSLFIEFKDKPAQAEVNWKEMLKQANKKNY